MAPLLEATQGKLVRADSSSATYEGRFYDFWCVGGVPNGGYSLGTSNSCVQDFLVNHLKSSHKDLFHISSTYLNATEAEARWTLDIQVTKAGKGFTNLDGVLRQKNNTTGKDTIRLQVRYIYTDMNKSKSDPLTEQLTTQPGSRYYPSFPCISEPKDCTKNHFEGMKVIKYDDRLKAYDDEKANEEFSKKNELSVAGYTVMAKEQVSDKDVAWFNNAALVLFVDTNGKNADFVPADAQKKGLWYPTMFLSIENKRELPAFPLTRIATVTRTRHVDHGQFEIDVEVWSHPDDADRFKLPPGVKSVMLCIARQVALAIPLSIQTAISKKNKGSKL